MFDGIWAEKYRPKKLDELILSLPNKRFFESLVGKQEIPNLLFIGHTGIGKTTLAKIIAKNILECQYLYINASEESGVDTIRSKIITFARTRSVDGKIKVVILDEADGLSSISAGSGHTSAQAALRNVMEEYSGTCRFVLTANYKHKIIPAIQSRCQDYDLTPPINGCIQRCIYILKAEKVQVSATEKDNLVNLIKSCFPDLRKAINTLQKCTIDGVLQVSELPNQTEFAEKVLAKILEIDLSINISDLRRYIIENELLFSNDYQLLLKGMFNAVYENAELPSNKKRDALICIADGLYRHNQVMDKEINSFATLLQLKNAFG